MLHWWAKLISFELFDDGVETLLAIELQQPLLLRRRAHDIPQHRVGQIGTTGNPNVAIRELDSAHEACHAFDRERLAGTLWELESRFFQNLVTLPGREIQFRRHRSYQELASRAILQNPTDLQVPHRFVRAV